MVFVFFVMKKQNFRLMSENLQPCENINSCLMDFLIARYFL